MTRRFLTTLAVALGVLAAPAHALDAAQLKAKLAGESRHFGAASGGYVVDLDDGRVLFARRENRSLAPASNQKLLTTAAALLRFGPEGTLATTLRVEPSTEIDDEGVLRGDLYLVGGGDPALDDRDLRALAADLADQGVVRIAGRIIGDESRFDTRRGSYDSRYRPDPYLGGWLSALAWGHGRAFPGGPALVSAKRLALLLKQVKIKADRAPRAGALPVQPGTTLASVPSPPMRTLAAITNQPSDNFYAEMLVKALGAQFGTAGSTTAGLDVVQAELAALGVHPKLADGSGLSRANRSTARQIVRLLVRMHAQKIAPSWLASLAVAGQSGTLAGRMRRTAAAGRCRGKTGTLTGVSALSGYCRTADGGTIAFSFLENGVCAVCAKRREDRMVAAIARYEG